MVDYKFKEAEILEELKNYIDSTYRKHYSNNDNSVQTFELISKIPLRGLYFSTSSAMKYADRFGLKEGYNRQDLLKIIHFGIMAMYCLDKMKPKKDDNT